jgi:hypothetical protein
MMRGTPVIDGQQMRQGAHFEKLNGKWRVAKPLSGMRKQHGLQGPIDDAFMDSFLVVNPPDKFQQEWEKWMRGDLRTKQAERVTPQDIAAHNLVLFGDASSNPLIAKINSKLPVRWSGPEIVAGDQHFAASDHTIALICPNPLNTSKYVVLNSGHTFGDKEFRGTNALLFPRLGDWAVIRKSDGAVVAAGLFNDNWQLETTRLDTTRHDKRSRF